MRFSIENAGTLGKYALFLFNVCGLICIMFLTFLIWNIVTKALYLCKSVLVCSTTICTNSHWSSLAKASSQVDGALRSTYSNPWLDASGSVEDRFWLLFIYLSRSNHCPFETSHSPVHTVHHVALLFKKTGKEIWLNEWLWNSTSLCSLPPLVCKVRRMELKDDINYGFPACSWEQTDL